MRVIFQAGLECAPKLMIPDAAIERLDRWEVTRLGKGNSRTDSSHANDKPI
jgi:hypothetical protein